MAHLNHKSYLDKPLLGKMQDIAQHYLNSQHIWCRLCELGVPKPLAIKISKRYETIVHPILYRGRK